MILHRRSGQSDARLGLQSFGCQGLFGTMVFDRLRFVQYHQAPWHFT